MLVESDGHIGMRASRQGSEEEKGSLALGNLGSVHSGTPHLPHLQTEDTSIAQWVSVKSLSPGPAQGNAHLVLS